LALLTLSGRERKGEEDGSDRRDEFHGRRGVVDFEVGWGILQPRQSSFLYIPLAVLFVGSSIYLLI